MNKKITLVFLIILFLFILTCTSYGAVANYESEHYIEWTDKSGLVKRICTNEDFYIKSRWINNREYFDVFSLSTETSLRCSVYIDGVLEYDNVASAVTGADYFNSSMVNSSKGNVFVYSSDGKEVFQQAPRLVGIVVQERGAMKETLFQIVAILPLILVVVVSLVGLRKAWSLLSTLLHKA